MAAYGTSHLNPASVIIYGGYLVRSVAVDGDAFLVKADFNRSTTLELFGVPKAVTKLILNGAPLSYTLSPTLGSWVAEVPVPAMKLAVPDLKSLDWTMVDSLPEIQPGYDDSKWVDADHTTTNNTYGRLWTPVSLYGSDYGFNTGTLIFRGHFVVPAIVPIATAPSAASRPARRAAYTFRAETASGTVTEIPSSTTTAIPTSTGSSAVPPASTQPARTNCTLTLIVQGGYAFAFSIFLNATYIGSWAGTDAANAFNGYVPLQDLVVGESYVITAIVDTTGMDENWLIGSDMMKNPRGILDYALMCRVAGESPIAPTPTSSTPRPATDTNTNTSGNSTNNTASSSSLVVVPIRWKLTGNLGGEDYPDRARGPLNEGGFFAERNGLHLPGAPLADRRYGGRKGSPFGVDVSARNASHGGGWVRFYGATLRLDLPSDRFDIPVSFTFVNATDADPPQRLRPFRALLYVNGWQFGKYASNIGPQTDFPVPEGILNYNGDNWIGLVVWTLDGDRTGPVSLPGFHLSIRTPVLTGREKVTLVESPGWTERDGAY